MKYSLARVSQPDISVIIPVINEVNSISGMLKSINALSYFFSLEVIVCDGGSSDGTFERAKGIADKVILSKPGRAEQMNAGANVSSGDLLLFLHADTIINQRAARMLHKFYDEHLSWGFFYLSLSGKSKVFRLIEKMICFRSNFTHIGTGDQCLFFSKNVFSHCGGFPSIPLMEDVAMSKNLRKKYIPTIIKQPVITSSRRWEENGIIQTVLLMWGIRLAYFVGISPSRLYRLYYRRNPGHMSGS